MTRARLRLREQTTLLEFDDGTAVTLAVGAAGLAADVLRHDPPTPAELERAIDRIEDALGAARLAKADRGALVTGEGALRDLPGLEPGSAGLTLDAVEALFQRLASRALGTPVAAADLPQGGEVAAALLILRECMHHLGFERLGAAAD